jgi:hypothetical protein
LLYWYQSTCFTGTKVQMLTQEDVLIIEGSQVLDLLALLALLVPKYLLYWYKSTDVDAGGCAHH